MSFQFLKRTWFSCVNPDTINFDLHVGKFFWVRDPLTQKEVRVEAEKIVGSKVRGNANNLEVWSPDGKQYQLPVIDFYAQLEGKRASKEELEHFEEIAKSAHVQQTARMRPSWAQRNGLWTPPSRKN